MTQKLPNLTALMTHEMAEELKVHGRHALIRLANDVDWDTFLSVCVCDLWIQDSLVVGISKKKWYDRKSAIQAGVEPRAWNLKGVNSQEKARRMTLTY